MTGLVISNWIQLANISDSVTLKYDGWPTKTIWHSSILCQALCIIWNSSVNSNWSYSPESLNSCQYWRYFVPCDLELWWMTLGNNRAPLLYYITLCASFQIHRWSEFWVTVLGSKSTIFFAPCDLEIRRMTLKNNRAPLLCCFKFFASCHSHWWIQTRVTV